MVIDIDAHRELAAQKGISSVPTVIVEKDGVEVARIVGAKPKSVYENAIND
jgi:thioredoxin-like negative regulator of GroEL